MESAAINFDVLIKSEKGSLSSPGLKTIDQYKPSPEIIEKCHRYLHSRGITCHKTDFGLSCSAGKELIEEVFGAGLVARSGNAQSGNWEFSGVPVIPEEIKPHIAQITFPQRPEFF